MHKKEMEVVTRAEVTARRAAGCIALHSTLQAGKIGRKEGSAAVFPLLKSGMNHAASLPPAFVS